MRKTYLSDLVGTVGQLLGVFLDDAPGVVRWRSSVGDAGIVGGQGWRGFGGFPHQLEDGQTDGDDEREERQLQGVPGLQAQHTDGERDQGEGLEHDEHHDGHEDLLELMAFACGKRKRSRRESTR